MSLNLNELFIFVLILLHHFFTEMSVIKIYYSSPKIPQFQIMIMWTVYKNMFHGFTCDVTYSRIDPGVVVKLQFLTIVLLSSIFVIFIQRHFSQKSILLFSYFVFQIINLLFMKPLKNVKNCVIFLSFLAKIFNFRKSLTMHFIYIIPLHSDFLK